MRRGLVRGSSAAEKPESPRRSELRVMDELCLAPQLCIRCRTYGHVVVCNANPCTCPDDETCSHSKKILKKKTISVPRVHDRNKSKESEVRAESNVESDDDCSSSSSSSSCSTTSSSSSSSSSSGTTTEESEESTPPHRRDPTSSS